MSRVGRSTASSTRRSGFVNPALVHASSRLDELPARPARCRRGSSGDPSRRRGAPIPTRRTSAIPGAGSESFHGTSMAALGASSAGHGASPASGPVSRPGMTPRTMHATARNADRAPHRERRLDRLLDAGAPRLTEQHQPDHLHEAQHRQGRGRGERSEREGTRQTLAHASVGGHGEQRLEREPLRREPVQRREPCDRHRADEESAAGPRHALQQSSEAVDLERPRCPLERPRAEEEKPLEDRVVERVQESGRECERRPLRPHLARAAGGRRRARAR